MNLNKEAEVFLGFGLTQSIILVVLLVIGFLLSLIVNMIIHNFIISLLVFTFIAANALIFMIQLKKLPDNYFLNYLNYLKSPKIYLPKRED